MIDRETLLIWFSGALVIYVVWIDIRPFIKKSFASWKSRNEPVLKIEFPAEINSAAKYGPNKRSTQYVSREATTPDRLIVSNYFFDLINTSNITIRNVSVQIHQIDNPLPYVLERRLMTQDGETSISMPPGYTAYFHIGYCHKIDNDAVAESHDICDRSRLEQIKSTWKHDPGFVLRLENNKSLSLLKNNDLRLILDVYGDDISPARHKFTINCRDKVEIIYDGVINPDESLAPRQPQGMQPEMPH